MNLQHLLFLPLRVLNYGYHWLCFTLRLKKLLNILMQVCISSKRILTNENIFHFCKNEYYESLIIVLIVNEQIQKFETKQRCNLIIIKTVIFFWSQKLYGYQKSIKLCFWTKSTYLCNFWSFQQLHCNCTNSIIWCSSLQLFTTGDQVLSVLKMWFEIEELKISTLKWQTSVLFWYSTHSKNFTSSVDKWTCWSAK